MKPAALLPLALALAAGSLACISDPVSGRPRSSVLDMSPEEERALGRQLAPEVEARFDAVVPDPDADRVLGELVATMVALSPRHAELEFEFKILNSSVPNALALPGGRIYITRGLLEDIRSEAEFIAVMGHEFGHVDHRHATRVPWSSALLNVPVVPFDLLHRWIPFGRRITGAASDVVGGPAQLVNLGFSRRQELEADRRGLAFAAEMGYDPRDFRKVFELFERLEEGGAGTRQVTLLRSHPRSQDRIRQIDRVLAREYPDLERQSFRGTSPEVEAVLATFHARAGAYALYDQAVAEVATGSDEARGRARDLVDAALLTVPDEPLCWILVGELEIHAGDGAAALAAFRRASAVYAQGSPGDGHWKPPFYLGAHALDEGDWRAGLELLETSARRYPGHGLTHYLIGVALEQAGDPARAAAAYRTALDLPLDAEVRAAVRERLGALP